MADFDTVFSAARQLSESDQLRLIDALWTELPADATIPLDDALIEELERRVAGIKAGTANTVSWESVRAAALDRLSHADQG